MRSWARVLAQVGVRSVSDLGSWATVAIIAAVPAVVVGGVWFMVVDDLISDPDGALLNATVASLTTFAAMCAVVRSLTRVSRASSGRHLSD